MCAAKIPSDLCPRWVNSAADDPSRQPVYVRSIPKS
jgi:hypothetical protein